ncbi:MmcB family DNA repair protein [Paralimibaculum aggregatum]|uniref:MmcB family DNA repair protein n=1 Tax=Paralimibaculum aggregatum TaxID=3036245 RepID=UPI0025554A20|nr:MmcB family DNA repair protein [Limibaculum sp. NKW23]
MPYPSHTEPIPDPCPQPGVLLARGVCRALADRGLAPLTEVTVPDGLRMDVCALAGDGMIWCVEVKSSRADFLSDRKWEGYRAWCDRLFFAVPEGFPQEILPADAGLMRADQFDAAILREAPEHRLAPARRKALTLRLARLAASRLLQAQQSLC